MGSAALRADLRSDTVTRPTPGMRAAMAAAEVGDDVYGEDPTVARLEERAAALFGHEAALFVPSGTMGNQISLQLLVPAGEELVCDSEAHVVSYELGAAAVHSGIQTRTFPAPRGVPDPELVAAFLRPEGYHTVASRAVAVEQTHNRGGGSVIPLAVLQALRARTAPLGVALHCDGARIFNAAVASGTEPRAYGALADTLSVCLSKGLGAPVGSLVVASADRIERARVIRKRMGGGMRQAGILAAAGCYALDHHVARLAEDHERARRLATRLAGVAGLEVDPAQVETNIVVVDLPGRPADGVAAACAARGVGVGVAGAHRLRLVTHLDVDDAAVAFAGDTLAEVLAD